MATLRSHQGRLCHAQVSWSFLFRVDQADAANRGSCPGPKKRVITLRKALRTHTSRAHLEKVQLKVSSSLQSTGGQADIAVVHRHDLQVWSWKVQRCCREGRLFGSAQDQGCRLRACRRGPMGQWRKEMVCLYILSAQIGMHRSRSSNHLSLSVHNLDWGICQRLSHFISTSKKELADNVSSSAEQRGSFESYCWKSQDSALGMTHKCIIPVKYNSDAGCRLVSTCDARNPLPLYMQSMTVIYSSSPWTRWSAEQGPHREKTSSPICEPLPRS